MGQKFPRNAAPGPEAMSGQSDLVRDAGTATLGPGWTGSNGDSMMAPNASRTRSLPIYRSYHNVTGTCKAP